MKRTPVLSLVVGTRNRPDDFRRLLGSVEMHTSVEWEMIVADASDLPLAMDSLYFPANVFIVPERPRKGFAAGMNRVMAFACGEWVLYLNDDCEVMQGYAEAAIRFMEAHHGIGLGAMPYSNKGGPFKVNSNAFDEMIYANFGIMRRSLGDHIGWFDAECVEMYGADNTLGFRVLLAGLGIAEVPVNGILHHESPNAERENMKVRTEQGERLKAKYLPRLTEMRAVYERTRLVIA